MYASSGPFYDVDKCEHEQKILECTNNLEVKACFRDHDEKSLYAVCTINICLYGKYVDLLLHPSLNYDRNVSFLLNMYVISKNFHEIVAFLVGIYRIDGIISTFIWVS